MRSARSGASGVAISTQARAAPSRARLARGLPSEGWGIEDEGRQAINESEEVVKPKKEVYASNDTIDSMKESSNELMSAESYN